eukprot:TRINITY_DN23838_c0_g2_i1.p1 TRINITY_DN23838_c0_g2~~TRINITY_DN23838_c0_g2_i1.p1  ORF type:complete len:408 (-),score=79.03 TRINITY_DN23838_c0_g2_i1:368-1591(-)
MAGARYLPGRALGYMLIALPMLVSASIHDVVQKVIAKQSGTWFLGVTIAVAASFLSTFGINLQKYSHMQNQRLPEVLQKPYYQQFLWCSGMCLLGASAICDFVALAFVAQSLIAPLGALSLTANILVAPCFLKEAISREDLVATLVTTVGCIVAVATANHGSTTYTFPELVTMFTTRSYLVFFFLSIWFMVGTNKLIQKMELEPNWQESGHKWLPMLYPMIGGTAGSFSVTFAKAFVELIKATIYGDNEFVSAGPYIVTVFLIFFSLLQVHYLNKGLERYPALTVIPVYQTCWILGCAAGGLVYFQEFRGFKVKDVFLFGLGLCITLLGVVLLSNKGSPADNEYDTTAVTDEQDLWLKSRRTLQHGSAHHATKTVGFPRDTDSLINTSINEDEDGGYAQDHYPSSGL